MNKDIQILNCLHGIYPRSESLVTVSRDFDRDRITQDQLAYRQKTDLDKLVKLQKKLDFNYIEDGKLNWQDIFRPIVEATDNLSKGALYRWFDCNTFFRQPEFCGKLALKINKINQFFPKINTKQRKITLPSPYTFTKLVSNRTPRNFDYILFSISEVLSLIINHLYNKGVSFFQLNEPFAAYYGLSLQEATKLASAINAIGHKRNFKLAVNFFFGDAVPCIKNIGKKIDIDIIGIDFFKTNLHQLPNDLSFEVMAGIVNGRNSLIEEEKTLARFVKRIINYFNLKSLYITHNCDLELVPENIAVKKLGVLAKVKELFNK